jgi:hypothetical protein
MASTENRNENDAHYFFSKRAAESLEAGRPSAAATLEVVKHGFGCATTIHFSFENPARCVMLNE